MSNSQAVRIHDSIDDYGFADTILEDRFDLINIFGEVRDRELLIY